MKIAVQPLVLSLIPSTTYEWKEKQDAPDGKGFRPPVRGVAMNPCDNPHGGVKVVAREIFPKLLGPFIPEDTVQDRVEIESVHCERSKEEVTMSRSLKKGAFVDHSCPKKDRSPGRFRKQKNLSKLGLDAQW